MRLVLAALVASTGCAQLFGIDETTAADADESVASIQVQHVSVGAFVVKGPQDMSNQTATFYDDTAGTLAPVPAVLAAMDTFTGRAGGNPSAIFTVPDMNDPNRMWALPARDQKGNFVQFEHPNPQPALPNSTIQLTVTLPSPYVSAPAAESFALQAIGAWMTHSLTAAELPAPDTAVSTINPAPIAYSVFNTMVGGNAKTRITSSDVVVLLRYTANTGTAGTTLATGSHLSGVFQAAPFEQTDGMDTIMGTMSPVPNNTPLMATIDPPSFVTRFAAVRPAVAGLSMAWRVNASPGWSVGSETGVRLNNGSIAMTETSFATNYGNPFESLEWKALFVFTTSSSRTYAYMENGMMANVGLSAALSMISEPTTSLNLTSDAGLPITITANQATLVTDGQTLTVDQTKPVVIEATLDRPTNTAYTLTLTQLGLDVSGAAPVVTRTTVLDAVTVGEPKFKLPPTVFTPGKTYYVTFRSMQGGLTEAATGNLQTVALPFSSASVDSAVFTVGMP